MRQLFPLAAVLALAGSAAGAPVPKAPVPPSLDGKYTLLATATPIERGPRGGFGGPAAIDRDNPFAARAARADAVITKTEITIEPRTTTALPTVMEYTLDPTKSPMAIDVELVPARGKKQKMLGVAEQSGNRLTIALAKEGAERPKSVEEADGVTVYYFQKAPPPPRTEYRIVALKVGEEEKAEKELNDLARDGFEVVSTASIGKTGATVPTTTHLVLKRVVK